MMARTNNKGPETVDLAPPYEQRAMVPIGVLNNLKTVDLAPP